MRFPVITVFFSLICLILQDDRTVICKQECLRFYVIASSAVCLVFTRFLDLSARAGEAALLVFKQYDNCNIHHCFFFFCCAPPVSRQQATVLHELGGADLILIAHSGQSSAKHNNTKASSLETQTRPLHDLLIKTSEVSEG